MDELFDDLNPPYATIVADPPWHYEARFSLGRFQRGETAQKAMPYSSLSVDQIRSLPVISLASPGAHLYLWTTQRYVWDSRLVVEGWGFRPLKLLTWCKPPLGLAPGGAFSNTTEFCLFARSRVGNMIRQARETLGLSQGDVDRATRGRVTRITKRWEDDDCYPDGKDWTTLVQILGLPAGLALEPSPSSTTWWNWDRGSHSSKPPAFLDLVEAVSPGPYVELFARSPRLGWDSWGKGYESGPS